MQAAFVEHDGFQCGYCTTDLFGGRDDQGIQRRFAQRAKQCTIDCKDFDAAISRLLATPSIPKVAISRKLASARVTPVAKRPSQR